MTSPPPIPDQPARRTFFHKAATASVLAIPLAILISLGQQGLDRNDRAGSLAVAGLSVLILLGGVIAGIVALCGIPRHGAKGILVKALVGAVIPIVLIGVAIPLALPAIENARERGKAKSLEIQLSEMVAALNKQKGTQIDEETRLDGAELLPGSTVVYKYSLLSTVRDGISNDVFFDTIRPGLLNTYKNHPQMKSFRENRVTLTYRYFDSEGALIGETSVGPGDL